MSDPVSNAEIEDVLSSIRRLVSEDASPLRRRKEIAEAAKERFVLTPALRVSEDETAEAETETGEASQATGAPEAAPDAEEPQEMAALDEVDPVNARFDESRQTLEQRIAELESALQQSAEEWEPDGSEVKGSAAPDMPSIADAPDAAESEMSEPENKAEPDAEKQDAAPEPDLSLSLSNLDWSDDDEAEPLSEDMAQEPGMAAVQSTETEPAVEKAEDQDHFGPGPEVAADGTLTSEPEADDPTAIMFAHEARDHQAMEDAQPEAAEAEEMQATEAPIGAAKRENPQAEPSISKGKPLPPELDIADQDDPVETAAQSDPAEIDAHAAQSDPADPVEQADPDDPADPAATADPDDSGESKAEDEDQPAFELFEEAPVLDEEALRDMVSQLVRDELQGVLGERITRNVRRLVRREIQRAIAMRELE